jgi:hypothetical protein
MRVPRRLKRRRCLPLSQQDGLALIERMRQVIEVERD